MLPLVPRHLGVPLSAFKMISMPTVCSVQTMHLTCTDTNTVFKRIKTRFHMTYVTYEFPRVRPKLFISLWFVQCKPCTYLALRLILSPNGPNIDPLDPHHLGVLAGASKMIYEPMVCLTPTKLTLSQNISKHIETRFQNISKRDSKRLTSPRSSIGCLQYCF
jgi:hypothetical protein